MPSQSYAALQSLYDSSPEFAPLIAPSALPWLAGVSLGGAFISSFYFSTIKRSLVSETLTAGVASALAGVGIVTLFCSVGVNV